MLIAAVGTASGVLQVPGFGFLRDFFSEVPDPPMTLAGPQPNEEVIAYSLVLFTFEEEDFQAARDMLDALEDRLPGLLLTLVPSEVDGERVHTLLAGPAVDRVEAENLRGPIAEVLTREDPDSWSVRETPRAFYLGERPTLPEAEDYLASVESAGFHAYILHVTFPDPQGSEGYQVLTGAFAGVQDARHLQLMLRDRGFPDAPLIERRGRLP
jgi:cell division septation protein DedD